MYSFKNKSARKSGSKKSTAAKAPVSRTVKAKLIHQGFIAGVSNSIQEVLGNVPDCGGIVALLIKLVAIADRDHLMKDLVDNERFAPSLCVDLFEAMELAHIDASLIESLRLSVEVED